MENLPDDLIDHLNLEFANRPDLGFVCWRERTNDRNGTYYGYEETIGIATLMLRGWTLKGAATLIDNDLIRVHPHVPGYEIPRSEYEGFVLSVGFVQLTDGTLWHVIADYDVEHARALTSESTSTYRCVATRSLRPTDDSVLTRIGHLLNPGRADPVHGFVFQEIQDNAPA